ncbi:MAG: DUF4388 domain-containing protein [Acidobacteriota bacterium]|nr:DUF4388 domain-containing protein [Blastocatellia bacterium]MDW8411713.1 DUF4388 domain-containing protein [Acidobacteriota bacterium]
MQGVIKPFSIAEVFRKIFNERLSGELLLRQDLLMKQIFFERGHIVFALSNRPEDRLGEMLVKQGKLTRERLSELLASVPAGTRLGKYMVDRGVITERELLSYLTLQMAGIVRSVYEWKEGLYQFLEGEGRAPEDLKLRFSTQTLILEGIRSITDFDVIRAGIGDISKYLAPMPNRSKIQSIAFSPVELSVLSLVKEPMDLLRVIVSCRDRPEKVLQAVYGLLAIGMLKQVEVVNSRQKEIQEMKQRLESKNPYTILGVAANATLTEIYDAYNRLASKFHPDSQSEVSAEERADLEHIFRGITESYNYVRSKSVTTQPQPPVSQPLPQPQQPIVTWHMQQPSYPSPQMPGMPQQPGYLPPQSTPMMPLQSMPMGSAVTGGLPIANTGQFTLPTGQYGQYTPVTAALPPQGFYGVPQQQPTAQLPQPASQLPQFMSKREGPTRAVSDEIDYHSDNRNSGAKIDINRALKEAFEYFEDKRAMLFAVEAMSMIFRSRPPVHIEMTKLAEITCNWARNKASVNNWPPSLVLVRVIGLIKQASDAGLLPELEPESFFPAFVKELSAYLGHSEMEELLRGLKSLG